MQRQVIMQLMGGLGNQMFQYATGRALALRLHLPLVLDTSWFASISEGDTPRTYQLAAFPGVAASSRVLRRGLIPRALQLLLEHFGLGEFFFPMHAREPHLHYWTEIERMNGPVRLEGYWQCERYFAASRDQIISDFAFPMLPEKCCQIAEVIMQCNQAISVHIRRGDYANSPKIRAFHGLLEHDYYRRGIECIASKVEGGKLFVFSDEPQWCKAYFDKCNLECTIVDVAEESAPWHDMHLMSLCRHHIIANSSFSWWGAWLAQQKGIVVAPKQWFLVNNINTNDRYPDEWIKI